MAAYAALLSLMHIIKQIQHHPRPPISLDGKQVDSLTENITFLRTFLECYSSTASKEEDEWESRIAYAAYAAEDVIESHIVDQIHGEKISSVDFRQRLQSVIQDMDLIKKEGTVMIKEKMGAQDHQLRRNTSISIGLVRSVSRALKSTMVDFGDILNDVMHKLTGQQHNLQIIPIVGMGGIDKTTLARKICVDSLIIEHFDIIAWVTVSQEYSRREILQVLCHEIKGSKNDLSKTTEDEIGETIYKHLWGRRYLIVMDDMWSPQTCDKIKSFCPDNNNGSRIMLTTRLSNLAFQLSGSHGFQMKFLDEDKSWDLLCKIVFGKEGCPIELEKNGREIARNCRGLPLSIVVIGGLLRKSKMTREDWKCILGNLNSLINLENNEHCLQILRTSYKELPVHLKPCFLYMGAFPEDDEICVSDLIKLWVAEGFLRPLDGKSLEVAADEYLKELFDRNLILIHELCQDGQPKLCKIHDLLRDLCLREAQKQRFLCVLRQQDLHIPRGINTERRICIRRDSPEEYPPQFLQALESASLNRSLLLRGGFHDDPSSPITSKLLRVYSWVDENYSNLTEFTSVEAIFQQPNLRYISVKSGFSRLSRFTSASWSLLWNVQSIEVDIPVWDFRTAPSEIWKMPQLRHVMINKLKLPNPPNQEDIVLENLQTLSEIWNFKCSEEMVKRIPNIRTLKLCYYGAEVEEEGLHNFCYNNLDHLQNLESLHLYLNPYTCSDPGELQSHFVQNLTFVHSLKNLTLNGTELPWEEFATKVGPLPHLEVLKLHQDACIGPEWETVEGQFCCLKFLLIASCNLKYWTTDSTHFPRLEHLPCS